jgi:hypothetical protein
LFHFISLCRELHFVVNWGFDLGILGGRRNLSLWLQLEGMDPTLSDFKKVLIHHEEFAQENRATMQQLSSKFGEFKQALATLSSSKIQDFELSLPIVTRRMDDMELDIQELKAHNHP